MWYCKFMFKYPNSIVCKLCTTFCMKRLNNHKEMFNPDLRKFKEMKTNGTEGIPEYGRSQSSSVNNIMEKTYKRVPFDIKLAKKIQAGEIEGKIVTTEGNCVRIVCFDRKGFRDSILALITIDDYEIDMFYTSDGEASKQSRFNLHIELPEETPKHDDVEEVPTGDGSIVFLRHKKHEFKVGDKVSYAGIMGNITKIDKNLVDIDPVICGIFHNINISEIKFIDDSSTDKPKYEFKPFDKVLVRNGINCIWQPSIFSYQLGDDSYTVSSYPYKKENIIPYEGNEHLVGTTDKPKED